MMFPKISGFENERDVTEMDKISRSGANLLKFWPFRAKYSTWVKDVR